MVPTLGLPVLSAAQEYDPGRLYGRILTTGGDVHEGFLRWDQNEGHWTDALDASKRIPSRYRREVRDLRATQAERPRGVTILGFRLPWNDDETPTSATAMIRLGHVRSIQVLDEGYALVTLKSGQEQEFRASTTDFGRSGRGIFIGTGPAEELQFDWDEVDRVDLIEAPGGLESSFGHRLYGTVQTADGFEFTGWIAWDRDEIFETDLLDGDEDGQRRSIAFEDIQSIERMSQRSSRVTQTNGGILELSGTNDVNDGNRGITVSDAGLGRARIQWHEFAIVRFFEPPQMLPYDAFDGGHLLFGTVTREDGSQVTGEIRWDNDEAWSWEVLDGEWEGIEVDVELGLIEVIRRKTMRSAEITLRDGRAFDMRGSNDVNQENKGIVVRTADGAVVLVEWDEFAQVVFSSAG
jgi:hypothetical protein